MILVTGIVRSGTSLMMQTLGLLGIPIAGSKWPFLRDDKESNPKGYWELDFKEMLNGITTDKYKGMAVKMYGSGLLKTRQDLVDKIIICERDPDACRGSIKKALQAGWRIGFSGTDEEADHTYNLCFSCLLHFVGRASAPVITVRYENMLADPKSEIGRVAEFVGSTEDTTKAIDNVGGV